MIALAPAVVLSLAAACAPGLSPSLVRAVAQTESGLSPLAIHDNTARESFAPADRAEAIRDARALIAAGHSVDLGLMQIDSANLSWVALSVANAFDPCESIRAGAKVLTGLSRYNSGSPTASLGYAVRVLDAEQHPQAPREAAPPVVLARESSNWNVFPPDRAPAETWIIEGDQ